MQVFLAFTCAIKRKQSRKSRICDTLKSAVLQSSKSKCHSGREIVLGKDTKDIYNA